MTIRPWCGRCDWSHSTADAAVIGRFTPIPLYQAPYPNAPLRTTRDEAEHDMCTYRKDTR